MAKPVKEIRANTYADDIKEIRKPLAWTSTFVIVAALLVWITPALDSQKAYDAFPKYQEIAIMANRDLNTDQRQMLVEWAPNLSTDDLDKDGFLKPREMPKTFIEAFLKYLPDAAMILLFIFSVLVAAFYWLYRQTCFYFADLPLRSFWGWFVLIAGFVGWPYFIVSRILLWRFKKRRGDEAEIITARLPDIKPKWQEKDFIEFYHDMLPFCKRLARARKNLAESENKVKILEEKLKNDVAALESAQSYMSRNLAKLNALKSMEDTDISIQPYLQRALHDFAEIKAMRGVKQIYLDDNKNLIIVVRCVYEHSGLAYDAGDFEIQISDSCVTACQTRSVDGFYNYGKNFCFGDSRVVINDYAAEGRLVEAIALAIESLSHINKEDIQSFLKHSKVVAKKLID